MGKPKVRFYFDVISPYAWLALMRAEEFAAAHGNEWDMRPIVYGVILKERGLLGPVQTPAKRRYTYHDVVRCATRAGVPLVGPPTHPFRTLEALRTLVLHRDLPTCVAMSNAAWGRGLDLTDAAVRAEVVASCGHSTAGLEDAIRADETKQALRELTDQALIDGVFGVPTFVHDGELFWGNDRMEHLAERLSGALVTPDGLADEMLGRATVSE